MVAGIDKDPRKIGKRVAALTIAAPSDLKRLVRQTGAEIGVLTVPAGAAREGYLALVEAGIRGVLNFTLQRLEPRPGVRVKNVDLRINLEELAFYLAG